MESQNNDVERQIEGLMDRIFDASNNSAIAAYVARMEKLERQKLDLMEKAEKQCQKSESGKLCLNQY